MKTRAVRSIRESDNICDLGREELLARVSSLGYERFRALQILDWLYRSGASSFEAMRNLPAALRRHLAATFRLDWPRVKQDVHSRDGCRKLLFELSDGKQVEAVIIPEARRLTLCVSTQVGCAMGCEFCATARLGLKRNLRPAEIVGQLRAASALLDRAFTNIVFMGMGEPLHNFEAVSKAIEIMSAPWGLGYSQRRITVSTVGLIAQMRRLLETTRVNLAVSLNAPDDRLRRRLMPVARRVALSDLMAACRALPLPRRKRVTFEYVLLGGVNDSLAHARALASLVSGIKCKINLIPFNPFPGAPFEPSAEAAVSAFQELLISRGLQCNVRQSRGRDIAAACGQLAGGVLGNPVPSLGGALGS